METLVHICDFHFKNPVNFQEKFVNESIYNEIREMAPSFHDVVKDCEWQQQIVNCSDIFVPILTGEGLCFVFNALNSKDIFTDE